MVQNLLFRYFALINGPERHSEMDRAEIHSTALAPRMIY